MTAIVPGERTAASAEDAEQLDLYSIICNCGAPLLGAVVVDVDLSELRMRWSMSAGSTSRRSVTIRRRRNTVRAPNGKPSVPPSDERRLAVFRDHVQRWLAKPQS